jgi:hypothetical protein
MLNTLRVPVADATSVTGNSIVKLKADPRPGSLLT